MKKVLLTVLILGLASNLSSAVLTEEQVDVIETDNKPDVKDVDKTEKLLLPESDKHSSDTKRFDHEGHHVDSESEKTEVA